MIAWILTVSAVVLVLGFGAARALAWQFALTAAARTRLTAAVWTVSLLPMLLQMAGVARLFRWTAVAVVLLWFVCLTAAAVWLCRRLAARFGFSGSLKIWRGVAAAGFSALTALSLYNAYTPVVRHARITLDKPLGRPLRVALASDLHLGVLVGARQIDKLTDIVRRERADIVLLPGDLMDDDTAAYDAENMRPHLQQLRAPLGVYATLGNHDLFGRQAQIARALREAGIVVLHDEAVRVDGRFWLAGRPDNLDTARLPAAELLRQTDAAEPVFLLDHRPDGIPAHAALPLDVQVSGHVHNGQVFPANFVVKLLNRLPYGHENINGKHFFVTSGFGFWGVPFRLGSQAEVWLIEVRGSDSESFRQPEKPPF